MGVGYKELAVAGCFPTERGCPHPQPLRQTWRCKILGRGLDWPCAAAGTAALRQIVDDEERGRRRFMRTAIKSLCRVLPSGFCKACRLPLFILYHGNSLCPTRLAGQGVNRLDTESVAFHFF